MTTRKVKWHRPILAGVVAWVGSMVAAILYIAPKGWLGSGDLLPMALWSFAFASVVAITADGVRRVPASRTSARTYAAALLIGPLIGFFCFFLAVVVRGGWVVSFPVFSCWAFGGFVGLLMLAPGGKWGFRLITLGLVVFGFLILLLSHNILRQLG